MNIELKNKRKRYYQNSDIKYNLLTAMKNREVIFMNRKDNSKIIRGLFITTTDYLDYFFNIMNFFERDYNIYVSVAKYKYIPMFTMNLSKRSKDTSKWFGEKAFIDMYEYDMCLDIDCNTPSNYRNTNNQTKRIKKFLDFYDLKYNFYPSGTGFQINIDGATFDFDNKFNRTREDKIFKNAKMYLLGKEIKERFLLNDLCLIGMGTHTKFRKCEYSLVGENVVFPFITDIDFKLFKYKNMDCNKILKEVRLHKRGLCYRNTLLSLNKLIENTNRFLHDNYLKEVIE